MSAKAKEKKDKAEYPITFGSSAEAVAAMGYPVLPLFKGDKNPNVKKDWPDYDFKRQGKLDLKRCADGGIGILTGRIVAADIDVRVKAVTDEIMQAIEGMLGVAPHRVGQAPKILLMYRAGSSSFTKHQTRSYSFKDDDPEAKGHKVEFLAQGEQFVAYGIHPDTKKPYQWNGDGDPLSVRAEDLPPILEHQAFDLVTIATSIIERHGGEPVGKLREADDGRPHEPNERQAADDPLLLQEALKMIPNENEDFDDWVLIGLAVKGALGEEGWDAFDEWLQDFLSWGPPSFLG